MILTDKTISRIVDVAIITALLLLTLSPLDVSLVFQNTNVAGGDMVSHPWIMQSLREQWSQGQLWSWNHGWSGGIPFLYFYFYPFYILAIIISILGMPDPIAFKLSVLIVVASVPTATYWLARRWAGPPAALLLTAVVLRLFFNEFDSISGGNLKSVMAGQVSHTMGLIFLLGLMGCVYKENLNSKTALFLMMMSGLCHVYTGIAAGIAVLLFIVTRYFVENHKASAVATFKTALLAAGLGAFFWLPFFYYRHYTVAPISTNIVDLEEIIRLLQIKNIFYLGLLFLGLIGPIYLLVKKIKTTFSIVVVSTIFILLTIAAASSQTPILHMRLFPQIHWLLAIGVAIIVQQMVPRESNKWMVASALSLIVLISFAPTERINSLLPKSFRAPIREVQHWWKWNMSGLESKSHHKDILALWNFLKETDIGDGRVAAEYFDYGSFGSPRVLEMTPSFSGKPIMEGLLLESSVWYPMYYYVSKQINPDAWWPGFKIDMPSKNILQGIENFKKFNVSLFIAHSETVRDHLMANGFQAIYKNNSFEIFRINESPSLVEKIEGHLANIHADRPLVHAVFHLPHSLNNMATYRKNQPQSDGSNITTQPLKGRWLENMQSYEVLNTQATVENRVKVIFKIPYFPNWRTNTGEAVELVSPNMMLVETVHDSFRLEYSIGWIEKISLLITLGSLLLLAMKLTRRSM